MATLPCFSPIGVVSPASYAAAKAFLAHQLERGLAADGEPLLGPENHGDLAVSHSVGGAGERLVQKRAHIGPSVGLGVLSPCVIVVGALGKSELVEHEPERIIMP